MHILLLGSGGREHAIARKIAESNTCHRLFIAPGNPGTNQCGTNIDLSVTDFDGIRTFVLENEVKMVVVGPEVPLVEGIADFFENDPSLRDIMVIGPSKEGAQLEGSKDYAKQFMQRHEIPTAAYKTFTRDTLADGLQFLATLKAPYVLKADGLAAGKGVLIIDNLDEARAELTNMLTGDKFGAAASKVVIEEYLSGIELSVFVLTDGKHYKILPTAKDYKRIGDGDTGLNTGGMGSISPVPFATKEFMQKVESRIVLPTVKGLAHDHISYKGFIFIGLMAVKNGNDLDPYVIEYNVRMGDPETESVFPRIKSDVVSLFERCARGSLNQATLEIDPRTAACVMMVSKGYPESYPKGKPIKGIEDVTLGQVFHAGTKFGPNQEIISNGGRVISVTCLADTLPSAVLCAYQEADKIQWEDRYCRNDIGRDLMLMMI